MGLRFAKLRSKELVEVDMGDCIAAEQLMVPWKPMQDYRPHPTLSRFFNEIAVAAPIGPGPWPARIYIDRRGTSLRRLVNEAEIIASLAPLDFVPVQLERHPLADKIHLFRHAECIVGPHGAGLANVVFAPAGCRIVELQMDSYVHWVYRILAAAGGLRYDCVIGRQFPSDRTILPDIHQQSWAISPLHVRAAVEHMLGRA